MKKRLFARSTSLKNAHTPLILEHPICATQIGEICGSIRILRALRATAVNSVVKPSTPLHGASTNRRSLSAIHSGIAIATGGASCDTRQQTATISPLAIASLPRENAN
jgi:hypothetical protein